MDSLLRALTVVVRLSLRRRFLVLNDAPLDQSHSPTFRESFRDRGRSAFQRARLEMVNARYKADIATRMGEVGRELDMWVPRMYRMWR